MLRLAKNKSDSYLFGWKPSYELKETRDQTQQIQNDVGLSMDTPWSSALMLVFV